MIFYECVLGSELESGKAKISENYPDLRVTRQLKLFRVPRSSFFYKSHREISRGCFRRQARDEIMNLYENMPFYGVPRLTAELKRRGHNVNHKRVGRLRFIPGRISIHPSHILSMRSFRIFCTN